jgi:hypothetical protein
MATALLLFLQRQPYKGCSSQLGFRWLQFRFVIGYIWGIYVVGTMCSKLEIIIHDSFKFKNATDRCFGIGRSLGLIPEQCRLHHDCGV